MEARWIPLSQFGRMESIEISSDRITVKTDPSNFRDNRITENIFMYWIEDSTVVFNGKRIERAAVFGITLLKKTIHRGGVFNNYGQILISFQRQAFMRDFMLCIYYEGKTGSMGYIHISVERSQGRATRREKERIFREISANLGMPLNISSISFNYDNTDREFWESVRQETKRMERNPLEEKYFEILGLERTEDFEIIRKAYRGMVKKYHPDSGKSEERPEREKKMQEINEAFEYLEGRFG